MTHDERTKLMGLLELVRWTIAGAVLFVFFGIVFYLGYGLLRGLLCLSS